MKQGRDDTDVIKINTKRPELPSAKAKRMTKVKLSDFEKYRANPFLTNQLNDGMVKRWKTVKENDGEIAYNVEKKEYGGALAVAKQVLVDPESFVKIFTYEMGAFIGFSKATTNLFFIIVSIMQDKKNEDTITLNLELANDWISKNCPPSEGSRQVNLFSKTTFYRALADLCANDFIAKHALSTDVYWINPMRMFNGNRLILAKQFIVAKNAEEGLEDIRRKDRTDSIIYKSTDFLNDET